MCMLHVAEGADPAAVVKVISSYLNYGKDNRESLAELFITLFVKVIPVLFCMCVSIWHANHNHYQLMRSRSFFLLRSKSEINPAFNNGIISQFVGSNHLVTFLLLQLVSVEKLWPKGLCVSLYEGSWISKSWGSRRPAFSVIEFSLSLWIVRIFPWSMRLSFTDYLCLIG